MTLYHPPDVDAASKAWGATCGPCSLAAALGRPLADVFDAVADPPTFRGWMTIGHMKQALGRAGASLVREWSPISFEGLRVAMGASAFEHAPFLACLQWGGPWPPRAAATKRHWVALRWIALPHDTDLWVYDWNAAHLVDVTTHAAGGTRETQERAAGGWLRWSTWEEKLLPNLLPERGDGTWRVQWAGAVRP